MSKKKPDDGNAAPRPSKRPPDLSAEAYSDDLTTAEILAQSPPLKPRRPRKRETSTSLGVYDADRDILDQYLFEVSKTPLLTAQQEVAIAKRSAAATRRPCRSWSSATCGSSSRWPRSIRTAAS